MALAVQVVLGAALVWAVASGTLADWLGDDDQGGPRGASAATAAVPRARVDRFDAPRALAWARRQVALGPRPAGSPAQRRAAAFLRPALPGGRFVGLEPAHPGLRNIEGLIPGRGRPVLVIAHYDTTTVPGYVGANNAAAAVGAVVELGRALRRLPAPRGARPVRLLLTDGEEPPTWPPREDFYAEGLRGSKFAAARGPRPAAVVVLDFIAQRGLRLPREEGSDPRLWSRLRAAAGRVGVARVFPDGVRAEIEDDHTPFARRGIPAIDLIDFDYPCWQRPCDTLDKLSVRSLDAAGEAVLELVRELRRP